MNRPKLKASMNTTKQAISAFGTDFGVDTSLILLWLEKPEYREYIEVEEFISDLCLERYADYDTVMGHLFYDRDEGILMINDLIACPECATDLTRSGDSIYEYWHCPECRWGQRKPKLNDPVL